MWNDCMATVAIYNCVHYYMYIQLEFQSVFLCQNLIELKEPIIPVLDMMQTIPSFVYLVPILMLLGIGKVPGLIAVCIYALPPVVRLTNLGIREVDKENTRGMRFLWSNSFSKINNRSNTLISSNHFCWC